MTMLERLVVKSRIQRTRQRVKRTSAARVMVWFGRSIARSFGRFARLLARSLDRSLNRSVARSLARSLPRSLPRSLARSHARLLPRLINRSIARSIACLVRRRSLTTKNFECSNSNYRHAAAWFRGSNLELLARTIFISKVSEFRCIICRIHNRTCWLFQWALNVKRIRSKRRSRTHENYYNSCLCYTRTTIKARQTSPSLSLWLKQSLAQSTASITVMLNTLSCKTC